MGVDADDPPDDRPQGVRIEWHDVAEPVRRALEHEIGSTVVEAVNRPGGFSPGTACRLRLANGDVVFVKAVSSALNEVSVHMHRMESRVLANLPGSLPVPRLRGSVELDVDGVRWIAVAIEHVVGRLPRRPWIPDELDRVLGLLTTVAALGTPCPVRDLPPVASQPLGGLETLDSVRGERLLDAWSRDHLADLVAIEGRWRDATAGDALLHFDVRADNVLLGPRRTWLVDWPHASVGAPWVDLMCMLPSAVSDGVADPEAVWAGHPLGRAADCDDADALLAALTGYFLGSSLLPPPPGIPTVRAFQRAQGEISLAWLVRRLQSR